MLLSLLRMWSSFVPGRGSPGADAQPYLDR